MNKKITVNLAVAIAILAMTVTFAVTMLVSMRMFDRTVARVRAKETMYNKLAEIDRSVRANFYGEINEDTLNDMLAAGYLAGIGDKSATYYTAKQYNEWKGIQSGKVIGVGADVVKDAGGYARIVRVYPGSPASDAALGKSMFITKIGETDVKTLSLSQINAQLRGEAGTSVIITVLDQTQGTEAPMELQRRQYDRSTVFYEVPAGRTTGYIQITGFADTTASELTAAVEAMQTGEAPITALVIDVRNNSSGSLENAMDAIDALCGVGPIASRQDKTGTKLLDTSDNKEIDLPVAVVVNGGTAYGAELFATSVRDFGKGRIVGVTTAGQGTIKCDPVALSDGSAIDYQIGILLTKNGESFDKVGVKPDVEVALKAEEEANFYPLTLDTDTQLLKAFETADLLVNNQAGQASGDSSAPPEDASVPPEGEPAVIPEGEPVPPETEGSAPASVPESAPAA